MSIYERTWTMVETYSPRKPPWPTLPLTTKAPLHLTGRVCDGGECGNLLGTGSDRAGGGSREWNVAACLAPTRPNSAEK